MNNTKDITIKDVVYMAKIKNRTIDKNKIIRAYEYAVKMHKDQKRKSGEPYIIHPLNVAYILADLGLDTTTICAALLHDVVEDTKATYEDIKESNIPNQYNFRLNYHPTTDELFIQAEEARYLKDGETWWHQGKDKPLKGDEFIKLDICGIVCN